VRIFIDAAIVKPELGGIATYVAGVVEGLAEQSDVKVCVATSTPEKISAPPDVDVVELPRAVRSFPRRLAWRERDLRRLVADHDADVLLAPTIEPPARDIGVPVIMVIHDLGPLLAPGLYGWKRWLRYAAGIGPACRRADQVVCVSNATLLQLRTALGRIATPCSVVGEAGRKLPVLIRAPRQPPYVLAVGAMLDHKNIDTLVRAMGHPDLAGVELQLAGPISTHELRRLDRLRAEVARPERIAHHGFVDLLTLAHLYAEASVVALPSLYEGFGLPMLEAMRAGAPVVASSIPAHQEVGGNAAMYVNEPLSVDTWAHAIGLVVSDPERSRTLERASVEHVADISWMTIGAHFAELFRELVATWTPS
jgi:glycosyltransferase involved in cell wall biosynthesis